MVGALKILKAEYLSPRIFSTVEKSLTGYEQEYLLFVSCVFDGKTNFSVVRNVRDLTTSQLSNFSV